MKYLYIVLLTLVFLLILSMIVFTLSSKNRIVPKEDLEGPIAVETEIPSLSIPKKLHQTQKKFEDLPKGIQKTLKRTEKLHPNCEYHFHDDEACNRFMEENFPSRVVNAYNTLIPGAYKADLFRYCMLYTYGGLYLDANMYCLKSFEDIVWPKTEKQYPFISCVDDSHLGSAYNAFIASVPKHPILAIAINICVHRIERREYGSSCLHPTGPYVLGDAINLYLNRQPGTPIMAGPNSNVLLIMRVPRVKSRRCYFGTDICEPTCALIYKGEEYADTKYPGYFVDYRDHRKKTYYSNLWRNKQIYRE